MKAKLLFGTIPLLLLACGDDVSRVTENYFTTVESKGELPECSKKNSGMTATVKESGEFYLCADSSWELLSEVPSEGETKDSVVRGNELCSTKDNGDGSFTQVCGKDTVVLYGTICGDAVYNPDSFFCVGVKAIPLCGGEEFDPDKQFCSNDSVYGKCNGRAYDVDAEFCFENRIVSLCGGEEFDLDEQFCSNDSVYSKCGGDIYVVVAEFCFENKIVPLCGGESYDLDSNFCLDGKVYKKKTLVWDLMNPEVEYGVFVDKRDNQVYRSVKIGEQTWMAENLNYAYNQKTSSLDSSSFCYNNDLDSCAKYGRYYLWSAAMDSTAILGDSGEVCGYTETCASADSVSMVRGVCPEGWHLPGRLEFTTLLAVINETNDFGFSALPAGNRSAEGKFDNKVSAFWSSDESAANYAYIMTGSNESRLVFVSDKRIAVSVRCVKDE